LKRLGKRGISEQALVSLILAIVVLIIIVLTYKGIAGLLSAKSDLEICRLGVIAQSETKFMGAMNSPLELDCPRTSLTITDEEVMIDGSSRLPVYLQDEDISEDFDLVREYSDLTEGQEEQLINYVFAEQMQECWYKMGEGELNVFNQDNFKDKQVCMVCSIIGFQDMQIQESDSFIEFIQNKNVPSIILDDNTTYYEFIHRNYYELYGSEYVTKETFLYKLMDLGFIGGMMGGPNLARAIYGNPLESNLMLANEGKIFTNQTYSVVFMAMKTGAIEETAGQENSLYFIVVGPIEQLSTAICDYLYT